MNAYLTQLRALTPLLLSAPRSEEAQLLDLDGTVFVMLGIFLALLLILWRFLWRPFLRVRDERVARVEGAKTKAAQLEADAVARVARIEIALADARRAANLETAKLRREAHAREQQIVADAQHSSHTLMVEARAKLDDALAAERTNLQKRTGDLARQIAEKALGRRLAS